MDCISRHHQINARALQQSEGLKRQDRAGKSKPMNIPVNVAAAALAMSRQRENPGWWCNAC